MCLRRATKQNPLEVHHIFEWALWSLLDHVKVRGLLDVLGFYEDGYVASARKVRPLREVMAQAKARPLRSADDVRNLVVLCQEHHRAIFTGGAVGQPLPRRTESAGAPTQAAQSSWSP